jgi:hypothetical protein
LSDIDEKAEKELRQSMALNPLELDEESKGRIWMKIQKATSSSIQVGSVDFSRKDRESVFRSTALRSVAFRYALSLVLLLAALLLFIFV